MAVRRIPSSCQSAPHGQLHVRKVHPHSSFSEKTKRELRRVFSNYSEGARLVPRVSNRQLTFGLTFVDFKARRLFSQKTEPKPESSDPDGSPQSDSFRKSIQERIAKSWKKTKDNKQKYSNAFREYKIKACNHLKEEAFVRGPTNLIKWIIFTAFIGLLVSQYEGQKKELNDLKKTLDELDQTVKDTLLTIKDLTAFHRLHLYDDFDPAEVQKDILKLELILQKIKDPDTSKVGCLLHNTAEAIGSKIKQQKKILLISLSLLKSTLLYRKREYYKAKQEMDAYEEDWKKILIEMGGLDSRHQGQLDQLKVVMSNVYNMYGLILRANAKMPTRDQDFAESAQKFLMGLKIALSTNTQDLKQLEKGTVAFEVTKTELDNLALGLAKSEIKEKELYSVFLSNLGFLFSQWNKCEDALRYHKIAYDLSPHSAAVINGLAYGLAQMGIFTADNPSLKEKCYSEAESWYKTALTCSPNNNIILSNQAELYLEIAEETADPKKKQEYYTKAEKLLAPVVERQMEKGGPQQAQFINYAIALSNLGRQEEAKKYLQIAKACKPRDIRIIPYINISLSGESAYQLPPVDSNRTLRKNYQRYANPPNFDNIQIIFSEDNVMNTKIETDRTIIRPVQTDDQLFIWEELYGNKETISSYHIDRPKSLKQVGDMVHTWTTLFKEGNPDSAYVVVSKEDPSQRIGLIMNEIRKEYDAKTGLRQPMIDPEILKIFSDTNTIIRPVQTDDKMFIWELYGNKETNERPKSLEEVSEMVHTWTTLFKEGNPNTAYITVSKEDPSQRIGLWVKTEYHTKIMVAPDFRGYLYDVEAKIAFDAFEEAEF